MIMNKITKENLSRNLDRVYSSWVTHSKFDFIPRDMNIEDFMYTFDERLSPEQKKFLRSLVDVMVEIQNFEENEDE